VKNKIKFKQNLLVSKLALLTAPIGLVKGLVDTKVGLVSGLVNTKVEALKGLFSGFGKGSIQPPSKPSYNAPVPYNAPKPSYGAPSQPKPSYGAPSY